MAQRCLIGLGLTALVVVVIAGGGCGARYSISVNALAAPEREPYQRYMLHPGNENTTPDDLQFREFAAYLEHAMTAHGYDRVESLNNAHFVVFARYGIGDPRQNVRTIPYRGVPIVQTYDKYTRWLSLTAMEPGDPTDPHDTRELWRVSAVSEGSNSDLREVFPYLVAAAQPYIGKQTQGASVSIELPENDRRVAEMRQGLHEKRWLER